MAQVHRFGDGVALALTGAGATRYLGAKAARTIGRALIAAAREIESGVAFTASQVGTVTAPDHDAAANLAPAFHVVTVESYSLDSGNVGGDVRTVYTSRHRSARAAARRLAELIAGNTSRAWQVKRDLGHGRGGRYTCDGLALNAFRQRHGAAN